MYEVTNQPPPLEPYNLLQTDRVVRETVVRENAAWAEPELMALGKTLGDPATIKFGFDANRNSPLLRSFDRYGHRSGGASSQRACRHRIPR